MSYRIVDNELERCQDWLGDSTGSIGYDIVQAIGLERNGELVAVTGYNNFTSKACHVHFSINKGAYPTKQYIWFVHYYPFIQAGLDALIALLPKKNGQIIRLVNHLGYEFRCSMDEADLMLYTMTKQNCRFI